MQNAQDKIKICTLCIKREGLICKFVFLKGNKIETLKAKFKGGLLQTKTLLFE